MGIASSQDIPDKKRGESQPWSVTRLFPFSSSVAALTKAFVNPFDVLLGYLVLIVGIAELIGRSVSWVMWLFTSLILLADVFERYKKPTPPETKEVKTKK